ncbi:hypothetical protein AKJ16_DCAP22035 [Drosera capensis]
MVLSYRLLQHVHWL